MCPECYAARSHLPGFQDRRVTSCGVPHQWDTADLSGGIMRTLRVVVLLFVIAAFPGCYAARVETGLKPSATVIKKTFASSWIYGLIPPKTVETAAKCLDGVAIVETQLSFVNQLVSLLTIGIYTPMQIVVTCAERPSNSLLDFERDFTIPTEASTEEIQKIFSQAADEAVRTHRPIVVAMAR